MYWQCRGCYDSKYSVLYHFIEGLCALFCLENGFSNYHCTVNKGLILPQYMLLLCPCPHSMVKRASVQTHKCFCSIFSHVECICQGPEVKGGKKKEKKEKKNWGGGRRKNRIGVCSGLMAFGHFWEKGLWSGSLEGGKWKCFRHSTVLAKATWKHSL